MNKTAFGSPLGDKPLAVGFERSLQMFGETLFQGWQSGRLRCPKVDACLCKPPSNLGRSNQMIALLGARRAKLPALATSISLRCGSWCPRSSGIFSRMEQSSYALAHPAVQSGVLPLVLACVVTGLLRFRGFKLRGRPGTAGLAVSLAFLASAWLIVGLTLGGPLSATQKLVWLVVAGITLGLSSEVLAVRPATLRLVAMGLLLAAALWLAWPQLERNQLDWPVAVFVLGCTALLYPLATPVARPAHESASMLMAAAGTAGIAVVSGSLLIAQLATALAMANVGFLAWNWPRSRDTLGASALLGALVPLLLLALMTVLLTSAPPWALAPLAAVFVSDQLVRRIWVPRERWREALQPLYVVVLSGVPVALGIALALLAESPDDVYYN